MEVGNSPIVQARFFDRYGEPANPDTVAGYLEAPDGTVTRITFVATATLGIWEASTGVLTQSGDYWVRTETTGAVFSAKEKKISVVPRKVPALPSSILPQMEVLSRGVPTYGSPGSNQPGAAVDDAYGVLWRSINSPNGSTPVWITLDMRQVPAAKRANTWAVIKGHVTTVWGAGVLQGSPGSALGSQAISNYSYLPRNYQIQGHASSGTLPASNDVGWTTLVNVVDNNYHTRVHTGLNLTTYNWIRVLVTASSGVTGVTDDAGLQIDIRDASAGATDSIFAYGDSITEEAFAGTRPDNALWVNRGPFEDTIEVQLNRWAPVITDGATIGWTAALADQYKADILPGTPAKYVLINFGSNDANGASVNLNTLGGVNSAYAKAFKASMRSIALYAQSLGKIAVIPHIPFGDLNAWSTPNIIILNQMIDSLIAQTPTILAGPDFYTFFQAHQNLLADHLHPTYDNAVGAGLYNGMTGYEHYIQMWIDWFNTHLYS